MKTNFLYLIHKRLLSVFYIENFSTYGTEKHFMSILDIEKCSILCIYNMSTYDTEKTKMSTSQK